MLTIETERRVSRFLCELGKSESWKCESGIKWIRDNLISDEKIIIFSFIKV